MKSLAWSSPRSLALACSLACGVGLMMPSEPAEAFCGFYVAGADAKLFNNATVVVLMRDGTRTVLSMQNDYQGPPEDFALVIPVPVVLKKDDVQILRSELFDRVETLASPRLVEYWEEDPCGEGLIARGWGGGTGSGYGRGAGAGFGGRGDATVTIEAQFAVGEYDISILSASDSSGLDEWLRDNGYNIPAGAEPLLRPYVQQDMKFFVAKVDPEKVKFGENGRAKLSPLRFHYDSKDFTLPVRLGLINAPDPSTGGKQDLLVHILAPGIRYQMANYPNVTIPTNLDLKDTAKEKFGEFYVSLFDHTLEQNPGAVVTEYAWGAGSCDPCPGAEAALTNQELLELGGDVLPEWSAGLSTVTMAVPGIMQGSPTVDGELDKDIIRRIVRAHVNEVRSCYNAGLARNSKIRGRVVVDFTIAGTGKVESPTIAETAITDVAVGECIAKAFGRWSFPKPQDGGSVKVSYPLTLSSGGSGSSAGSFVLTRLHARYDATALGEDLVFEAAPAIAGGREMWGGDRKLEQGATVVENGINNFQARYAMRHAWTGEIACAEPVRRVWGGPPSEGPSAPTVVARQLADVGRGASLGSFITAEAGEQIGMSVAVVSEPPVTDVGAAEKAPAEAESAPTAPTSGCACSSESEPELPAAALALLALLGLRRSRARRDRGSGC
jgi:MYXO-CTERM domain-containing protein